MYISKVRCSSAAFLKMLICRLRFAQTQPQKRKMQNSCFSKVVYIQKSRNTSFSCDNVTPSPRTVAPSCLPLDIKDSLKKDMRLLGFWLLDEGSFFCCGRL
jgi:hypothetical protein